MYEIPWNSDDYKIFLPLSLQETTAVQGGILSSVADFRDILSVFRRRYRTSLGKEQNGISLQASCFTNHGSS